MKKILLVRSDRLGDVILSTPCLRVAGVQVLFWTKAEYQCLLGEHALGLPAGATFWQGVAFLKSHRFDAAVVLYGGWREHLTVFFARIPLRVGRFLKLYSLFLNRPLRQKRSRVAKHEVEYNLDCLKPLDLRAVPELKVQLGDDPEARSWLVKQGLSDLLGSYIVVHAGMGGSALNWKESRYQTLVQELIQAGRKVVLTGGPLEIGLVERLAKAAGSGIIFYKKEQALQSVAFLGTVLRYAQVVIAPSTGPLHLASALGVSCIGLYPPLKVQSWQRWGPWTKKKVCLVPPVVCPERFHCRGQACQYFPCMDAIRVSDVIGKVQTLAQPG